MLEFTHLKNRDEYFLKKAKTKVIIRKKIDIWEVYIQSLKNLHLGNSEYKIGNNFTSATQAKQWVKNLYF